MNDLAIVNGTVCDGFNTYKANVYVKNGKISAVSSEMLDAAEFYDAHGLYVLPGLIDPHVHFALKLGKYVSADDFESGSIGAAFGGVTTYIDFLDPVTNREDLKKAFDRRMELARDSHVNFSFHTTIAHPTFSAEQLCEDSLELGINSIKSFTTYSSSNRMTGDGFVLELLKTTSKYGVVATFHAENDDMILRATMLDSKSSATHLPIYHSYEAEAEAVSRIATLARLSGGQAYIVHNSSGRSVKLLKENGIPGNLRLETCPQYFVLNDEVYSDEESAALHALVPPLRSEEDMNLMRVLFREGVFNTVGTDHCPFKGNEKLENVKNYDRMPNGIGSVELSFSIFHELFVKKGDMSLKDLVKIQSFNVAEIFGLTSKGRIAPGYDADISIFDPKKKWKVSVESLHTKSDYTPYEGMELEGKFVSVLVNGNFVIKDGVLFEAVHGEFVKRGPVFWHIR